MPNLKATNLWATDYSKLGKYQVWTTKIEEEKATSNIFHDKYQPLNTRHYGKWDKKMWKCEWKCKTWASTKYRKSVKLSKDEIPNLKATVAL